MAGPGGADSGEGLFFGEMPAEDQVVASPGDADVQKSAAPRCAGAFLGVHDACGGGGGVVNVAVHVSYLKANAQIPVNVHRA